MIGCKDLPGFLYIKQKEGEREQDSRETEKVCVRGRALQQKEDSVSIKTHH